MKIQLNRMWIKSVRVFNFKHQLSFSRWHSVLKCIFFPLSRAALSRFLSRVNFSAFNSASDYYSTNKPQDSLGRVEQAFSRRKSLIGRNHLTTNDVFPLIKIACFVLRTRMLFLSLHASTVGTRTARMIPFLPCNWFSMFYSSWTSIRLIRHNFRSLKEKIPFTLLLHWHFWHSHSFPRTVWYLLKRSDFAFIYSDRFLVFQKRIFSLHKIFSPLCLPFEINKIFLLTDFSQLSTDRFLTYTLLANHRN